MTSHPLTMAFRDHDYRVVEYRPNLFDELAAENAQRAEIERIEKLARQARRKVKARAFIGYAVMVLVAVAIGIWLAVGHS